jgi:hypothetical protein
MKNPNTRHLQELAIALSCALTAFSAQAAGFNSGSTGVDGAFNPTANIIVTLPANGRFNYTTVNIPAGVTVKYVRSSANPSVPAILLATGDVTIAGTIDVSGGNGRAESLFGAGGSGGYDGGRGGAPQVNRRAGNGLGPGAGGGGDATPACCSGIPQGGGGAGYAVAGSNNRQGTSAGNTGLGGAIYGSNLLTPLIGGSGGGGGAGAPESNGTNGSGGGGGGGAILIASSVTVSLTGAILAQGGNGGSAIGSAASGGGGSGGAIRIVASNFVGAGTLNVNGGTGGTSGLNYGAHDGGDGGRGRSSVEVVPTGTLDLAGGPVLTITSVAGVSAPAAPTGTGDVSIPVAAPNPATVAFSASGVPIGNTVALTLTPLRGAAITATSSPLAGSVGSSTATASINIPQGISTLTASGSYTITVAMGEMLRQYAGDERVAKVTLTATYGGASTAKLITVSGKEYEVPAEVLRMVALDG